MHRTSSSVFNKLLIIVMIALLSIAAILAVILWNQTKTNEHQELSFNTRLVRDYMQLTFRQRELGLLSIGQRMLDYPGEDGQEMRLEIARNALKIWDEFLAIGLADTSGQVYSFTGSLSGTGPNLNQSSLTRRSFQLTKQQKGLSIGEPYYFEAIEDWILPIRVPLYDEDGELVGVNTSAIDLQRITSGLAQLNLPQGYHLLVRHDLFGTLQLYYPLEKEYYGRYLRKPADFLQDTSQTNQIGDLKFFNGYDRTRNESLYASFSPSVTMNHDIILTVDKDRLWAIYWKTLKRLIIVYLLINFLTIGGFIYIRRKESQFEEKIKSEKDYSQAIIQASPVMIVGMDEAGKCTFLNPATENITGYKQKEVIHKQWWKLIHPETSDRLEPDDIWHKLTKDRQIIDYETTVTTKTGAKRIISWNSLLSGSRIRPNEFVAFGSDITSLKEAQAEIRSYSDELESIIQQRTEELELSNFKLKDQNAQLDEQQKETQNALDHLKSAQKKLIESEKMASLGILAAGVGHEINNPLNFIKGGVLGLESLMNKNQIPVEAKALIDVIIEGVDRASTIVHSLGHFSRQGPSHEELCKVEEVLDNCLVILHNRLKKRITVEKEYATSAYKLIGNEGRLHQAFLNILSNAEQAISDQGRLLLKTQIIKDRLLIIISDDGCGIDDQHLSRISDPFFTTKAPGKGTGLGLYLTYSIIHEHDGQIDVTSTVGKGTTFNISLPVSANNRQIKTESSLVNS